MRREFIIILVLVWGTLAQATILDVTIEPEEPTVFDSISIITKGMENYGAVKIESTEFHIDGTSLELNLFLKVGTYCAITPWQYCEDIGTLSAGLYELTVWSYPDYTEPSSYNISFEVIPEPGTVLLFGLGGIVLRRRKWKR